MFEIFRERDFFTLKYIRRSASLKESFDNAFIKISPSCLLHYIQISHIWF